VQIRMKSVELSDEFAKIPSNEMRLMAIQHCLREMLATRRQPSATISTPLLSDIPPKKSVNRPSRATIFDRVGILIGHAMPNLCRDHEPLASRMSQIQMSSVVFTEAFAAMKPRARVGVIRERIQ
jgi:hypothetical protein